jgi:hypothetical protein
MADGALGMGPIQKITRGKNNQARGAGCYLLRWRWANNPLALPSLKAPAPSLLIYVRVADPTCLVAGRD